MTNYIQVPVPEERVQEVYELLARHTSAAGGDTRTQPWDEESLTRMWHESSEGIRRLLVFLSRVPDEATPIGLVAGAIGADRGPRSVAGMLGAFTRRCRNRYGREMPIQVQWLAELDENGLVMPSTHAKVIRMLSGMVVRPTD